MVFTIVIVVINIQVCALIAVALIIADRANVGLEKSHRTLSAFDEVVRYVDGELVVIAWHNISVFDVLVDGLDAMRVWRAMGLGDLRGSRRRRDITRCYVNARL